MLGPTYFRDYPFQTILLITDISRVTLSNVVSIGYPFNFPFLFEGLFSYTIKINGRIIN